MNPTTPDTSLLEFCKRLTSGFDEIPSDRKTQLKALGEYIARKIQKKEAVQLTVICTHNSRRSHIGQLALQAAAQYYNLPQITSYSGGTEATAFNPNAIAALRRVGFDIKQKTEGANPVYLAEISINGSTIQELFSKVYDTSPNPQKEFAAIMVCTEADAGCPIVSGAEVRFAVPFNDPKNFDNTPEESIAYDQAVSEISCAFFFAMDYASKIQKTKPNHE